MVKDIERLDAKLHRHPLRQFRFLKERQVHLPTVQSPNDSISGIAEAREVSIRVHRRGLKRGGIDEWHPMLTTARQSQRYARNDVRSLIRLIVTIGKEVSARKRTVRVEKLIVGIGDVAAQVHLNRQWMPGVPQSDSTQVPSPDDFAERAAGVQISLARSKGKFIHTVHSKVVADIEDTWPPVAMEEAYIFRPIPPATPNRTVIDGKRPGGT